MQDQLQKAINLAKKTGDRIIIFDSARPRDAHVVMSLDEYEILVAGMSAVRGLTEEELVDKINRDIAIWKSENETGGFGEYFPGIKKETEREKRESFYSGGLEILEKEIWKKKEKIKGSNWAIPVERKKGADEIIEEDRQYLEEINF